MGAGAGPGDRPPLDPGRGPGWAKLAEAVALRVPPSEIETIYLFRPWKREGREWGTAVVACRATEGGGEGGGGRLRVYTARYMLIVRGKERGQSRIEVEETALSPADVIARVMQAAAERTGDPEPPVRSEEHTSELQSPCNLVCRLLLEKKTTKLHRRLRFKRRPPRHSRHRIAGRQNANAS